MKHNHQPTHVLIPLEIARDASLSFQALGLYCHCMSYSEECSYEIPDRGMSKEDLADCYAELINKSLCLAFVDLHGCLNCEVFETRELCSERKLELANSGITVICRILD